MLAPPCPTCPPHRRPARVALLTAAALVLLTVLGLSGPPWADATPAHAAPAGRAVPAGATTPVPGRFTVVGRTIHAPDGSVFVPHGANIGMLNAFNANGTAEGHAQDMLAWNWNIDRQTFYCTNRAAYSTRLRDGYARMMRGLDRVIADNTRRGIVTVVTCFDPSTSLWGAGGQVVRLPAGSPLVTARNADDVGKTYEQQFRQFWTDTARTYRDNPSVWFDPVNEPAAPSAWYWRTFYALAYDAIRSQGADNVITVEAPRHASDTCADTPRLADPDMAPALMRGRTNLLFDVHAYGFCTDKSVPGDTAAAYRTLFARNAAAGIPFYIGEFGYAFRYAAPEGRDAAAAVLALGPAYGVGLVVWHATGNDYLSLKANGTGFYRGGDAVGLSPLGQQVWDYNHALPPVRAPG